MGEIYGYLIFSDLQWLDKEYRLQDGYPSNTKWHFLSPQISHIANTLRQRQNGRHFPDNIFNSIFLNENVSIPIKISLKFVP